MLRRKQNINKMNLKEELNPIERRLELVSNILKDSTFYPKTVSYKDIDKAFNEWVEDELRIVFEDKVLPTYALFSNQRFTEYMQMWENVDENRNVKMNFKVITRDNNPRDNGMYAKASNVPYNKKYLMNKVEAVDDQGKKCYVEFRMAQPVTVDMTYRVTVVTNKFELLNEFNTLVRDKFKSIQCYLFPNGHPMPMKLGNIMDDSDYTAEDRQYFSQTFEIILMGYVLRDEDFETVVKPIMNFKCISVDTDRRFRASVEIEEPEVDVEMYYNQPIIVTVGYEIHQSDTRDFTIDTDMEVEKIDTINIRNYTIKVNGVKIIDPELGFSLKECDDVTVKINRINYTKFSRVILEGKNPNVVYDKNNDLPESVLDEVNISEEISKTNE